MNDSFPYIYWYGFGGIVLLALLSSFFIHNFWYKPSK